MFLHGAAHIFFENKLADTDSLFNNKFNKLESIFKDELKQMSSLHSYEIRKIKNDVKLLMQAVKTNKGKTWEIIPSFGNPHFPLNSGKSKLGNNLKKIPPLGMQDLGTNGKMSPPHQI